MGITMKSPNHKISLGYGGFMRLRLKVAELTNNDIFEHYRYLCNYSYKMTMTEFADYDERTEELEDKYNGKMDAVFDFLYASDTDAILSPEICSMVYGIVKDYDDNIVYG